VEEAILVFATYVELTLEAIAIVIVAGGAAQAVMGLIRFIQMKNRANSDARAVWLAFAHWLIAALTFQLAADIVHTTVAPGWDDIGRVAAIALVRTFLTFFLDRDIDSIRRQQRRSQGESHARHS
jgi:uncharacterized membrane protein